tara:strand:- start:347 stop:553 length:207 start_codon:yes stop_codon:yes gene_type:complete
VDAASEGEARGVAGRARGRETTWWWRGGVDLDVEDVDIPRIPLADATAMVECAMVKWRRVPSTRRGTS